MFLTSWTQWFTVWSRLSKPIFTSVDILSCSDLISLMSNVLASTCSAREATSSSLISVVNTVLPLFLSALPYFQLFLVGLPPFNFAPSIEVLLSTPCGWVSLYSWLSLPKDTLSGDRTVNRSVITFINLLLFRSLLFVSRI